MKPIVVALLSFWMITESSTCVLAQNSAVIRQSGSGNQIFIRQTSPPDDSSKRTQTVAIDLKNDSQILIDQQSGGPNTVDILQDDQRTILTSQSSLTSEPPAATPPDRHDRSPKKRRNRQP